MGKPPAAWYSTVSRQLFVWRAARCQNWFDASERKQGLTVVLLTLVQNWKYHRPRWSLSELALVYLKENETRLKQPAESSLMSRNHSSVGVRFVWAGSRGDFGGIYWSVKGFLLESAHILSLTNTST